MKFDQILKIVQFFTDNLDLNTDNLILKYQLARDDYELLDKDLWVRQNRNLKNYVKNKEIELILGKVKFIFEETIV
jgi:hypothetical protein